MHGQHVDITFAKATRATVQDQALREALALFVVNGPYTGPLLGKVVAVTILLSLARRSNPYARFDNALWL